MSDAAPPVLWLRIWCWAALGFALFSAIAVVASLAAGYWSMAGIFSISLLIFGGNYLGVRRAARVLERKRTRGER